MSTWQELGMDSKIEGILRQAESHNPEHHFGNPFLTSYQIALRFSELYPGDVETIGKPIGGKGTGQQDSLAQYIADQLSKRIRDNKLPNIEGRFLYRKYLTTLQYDDGNIESSTGQAYDLSMYRLKD
jgi:hypothetical protein